MIYIFETGVIVYDESYLSAEDKLKAIALKDETEIPEPETREGFRPVLKANLESKLVYYDYEKIEKTSEELLQERVTELENVLMLLTV